MELFDQYQRLEIVFKLGRGRYKKAEQAAMQEVEPPLATRQRKVRSTSKWMKDKP
jgi:hypothetical protein